MKSYMFSKIENQQRLKEALYYVHTACHGLCKLSFYKYFDVAGNIAVFSHYEDEFERLKLIQQELCNMTDNFNQKYFRLKQPIVIPEEDGMPGATYTHLYIRKPDPYRHQVGDLDFYLSIDDYKALKESVIHGSIKGARVFERPELDMIELFDPDVDALAYVSTHNYAEKVRSKQ